MAISAENTSSSYKCSKCGAIFSKAEEGNTCPVCGFTCTSNTCWDVNASDEGY